MNPTNPSRVEVDFEALTWIYPEPAEDVALNSTPTASASTRHGTRWARNAIFAALICLALLPAQLVAPMGQQGSGAVEEPPIEAGWRVPCDRDLHLRNSPLWIAPGRSSSNVIVVLPRGQPIDLLTTGPEDSSGNWRRVRAGSLKGWVHAKFLERETGQPCTVVNNSYSI